jgi:hypothetical protein
MNRILTHVFQKKHRSGNITWVVRWKDPKTGRWKRRFAGKTKDEALLIESEVRRQLALGQIQHPRIRFIARNTVCKRSRIYSLKVH